MNETNDECSMIPPATAICIIHQQAVMRAQTPPQLPALCRLQERQIIMLAPPHTHRRTSPANRIVRISRRKNRIDQLCRIGTGIASTASPTSNRQSTKVAHNECKARLRGSCSYSASSFSQARLIVLLHHLHAHPPLPDPVRRCRWQSRRFRARRSSPWMSTPCTLRPSCRRRRDLAVV